MSRAKTTSFFLSLAIASLGFTAKKKSCAGVLAEQTDQRLELITEAQGESFTLKVALKGRTVYLSAKIQNEIEGRFAFERDDISGVGLDQTSFAYDRNSTNETRQQPAIYDVRRPAVAPAHYKSWKGWRALAWPQRKSIRDVMLRLLDLPSCSESYGRVIKILPLSYEGEMFHDPKNKNTYAGPESVEASDFVEKINLKERTVAWLRKYDFYNYDLFIGVQNESSTYFETTDRSLWNNSKMTLRVKEWTPSKKGVQARRERKRIVTLKISQKYEGYLSHRQESQVPIPADFTDADVEKVAQALALHAGAIEKSETVKPLVMIENIRQSVNVFHQKLHDNSPETMMKIGFLTFDSFRARLPNARVWSDYNYQMEMEFFSSPEIRAYINVNGLDLEVFSEELRSRLGTVIGHPTKAAVVIDDKEKPKFLTALEALE